MVEHLQVYWKGYLGVAVCLIPILYLGRRYITPIVMYIGEMIAYIVGMHAILWTLVRVCVWFKVNSRMYWHRDEAAPPWSTPWTEWWRPENYHPTALFWIEVVVAAVIIIGVIRYRPLRAKQLKKRGPHIGKGVGLQGVQLDERSGGASSNYAMRSGNPGSYR